LVSKMDQNKPKTDPVPVIFSSNRKFVFVSFVDTLFCGDEKGRCYATTCVLGGAMCREMLSELEELHWFSNSPKDRIITGGLRLRCGGIL